MFLSSAVSEDSEKVFIYVVRRVEHGEARSVLAKA